MIAGRSASRSSAAARSMAAASAPGPVHGSGSGASDAPPSASPNTWSSGKSTNAGPEWGVTAALSACSSICGISAVLWAVAACLTTGATKGTWSISCSEPWPQRNAGARPPSTSIGELFWAAEAIALMPLVTPGPAVRAHTPGVRVTLAQPSAAKAAACSWRTSTMSMPSARQPS